MTEQRSIGDLIRHAYRDREDCPPPEAYLEAELAALDVAARERLESHAESCAACAAQRDLAKAFESSEATDPSQHRDVERIARRLERHPPYRRRESWLAWLPSWASIARAPAFQLGLVAVLLIGVGIGVRNASTPPPLSGGPDGGATRSSVLEVTAPVGELAEIPAEFAWRSINGAVEYVITIRDVDDAELWRATTPRTAAALDGEVIAQLRPAVWYVWTVEAHDETGRIVARSPEARFRVKPDGAEPR